MPRSTIPATLVFLPCDERLGHAVLAIGEAVLLEPRERPAAVGIEVALLLGQDFVERLVDERERLAHGELVARCIEHLRVAGEDGHAGADGGLCEIDRGDVAVCRCARSCWQLGL